MQGSEMAFCDFGEQIHPKYQRVKPNKFVNSSTAEICFGKDYKKAHEHVKHQRNEGVTNIKQG